jgi:t-SNARE complex subunit (syntaxin)
MEENKTPETPVVEEVKEQVKKAATKVKDAAAKSEEYVRKNRKPIVKGLLCTALVLAGGWVIYAFYKALFGSDSN